MQCTLCWSVMSCQSEIHRTQAYSTRHFGSISQYARMDLHCWNKECPSRHLAKIYHPHFGVLIEEGYPWLCDRYHLPFLLDGIHYALDGDYTYHSWSSDRVFGRGEKHTMLLAFDGLNTRLLLSTDFIPISTGDDMRDEAWKLFWRLKKLIAFA
jgi:hypothetical protein